MYTSLKHNHACSWNQLAGLLPVTDGTEKVPVRQHLTAVHMVDRGGGGDIYIYNS